MATAPDTLVVTGPNFQQIAADAFLITPTGGAQGKLADFVNGGTVAQTIAAGSTLPSPLISGIPSESIANAITASTTQTLAGAVPLTAAFNVVSVVGTANDAVKLPPVTLNAGFAQVVAVVNNGASALAIFATESATAIDTHATATAATLTTLHRAFFIQNTASTWVSIASVSAAS